jgi:hypothetical protein
MDNKLIRKMVVLSLMQLRGDHGVEENTVIFGDGCMDSMTLVIFLAELEARIAEETGRNIVLASERAMSRSRSPYRDVDSLVEFVQELLAGEPSK